MIISDYNTASGHRLGLRVGCRVRQGPGSCPSPSHSRRVTVRRRWAGLEIVVAMQPDCDTGPSTRALAVASVHWPAGPGDRTFVAVIDSEPDSESDPDS